MEPLGTRLAGGSTPALDRFGVDSEHGRMHDVLLGDPATFRWLGIENATYSALVRDTLRRGHRFDREAALAQHGEMVAAFRDAGVTVHLLAAREELAYGVYTRDSSVMTPWGAIVCQLANPRRRGEYAACLEFYAGAGISVYDMVTAGNFEGGDFALVAPGAALIGYTGVRSEEVGARQVGGWLEAEGWDVCYAPIDEFYVHLDLMVCMVAPGLAAVCTDTTDPGRTFITVRCGSRTRGSWGRGRTPSRSRRRRCGGRTRWPPSSSSGRCFSSRWRSTRRRGKQWLPSGAPTARSRCSSRPTACRSRGRRRRNRRCLW